MRRLRFVIAGMFVVVGACGGGGGQGGAGGTAGSTPLGHGGTGGTAAGGHGGTGGTPAGGVAARDCPGLRRGDRRRRRRRNGRCGRERGRQRRWGRRRRGGRDRERWNQRRRARRLPDVAAVWRLRDRISHLRLSDRDLRLQRTAHGRGSLARRRGRPRARASVPLTDHRLSMTCQYDNVTCSYPRWDQYGYGGPGWGCGVCSSRTGPPTAPRAATPCSSAATGSIPVHAEPRVAGNVSRPRAKRTGAR